MPVPSGLVSSSLSPGRRPVLEATLSGSMSPVTERPYLISSSSTLWPPTSAVPASRSASDPPRRMSARMDSGSRFTGKQTMFMAHHGVPPMA